MTFRSDLDQASSAIERAIALNDSMQAERQRMIAGLNQAIALFGCAVVVFLSFALVGAPEMSRGDQNNQENGIYVYRR
jgi:hypothetical protein